MEVDEWKSKCVTKEMEQNIHSNMKVHMTELLKW